MNRKKALDRIAELLARFTVEVKTLNKGGLYDINIHAENVLVPIINTVFGVNVVNANKKEKNAAAIDLIDSKNRICFQVTSTADSEKVKHTLRQFVKYGKENHFDLLFIYIISEKQKSYTGKGFDDIINGKIDFNKDEHIIDNNDLFEQINSSYSIEKINVLKDLLEKEFSEEKIKSREKSIHEEKKLVTERIYSNVLHLSFPERLFIADVDIDRDEVIKMTWETEFRLKMNSSARTVFRRALSDLNMGYFRDWHLFGKKLITFRDLNNNQEALRNLIDAGTIDSLCTEEFYSTDEKHHSAFAELLKFSFQEKCFLKGVKWLDSDYIFYYMPSRNPKNKNRKVTWKSSKRTSTRSVVAAKVGEKKQGVMYYKHLAFRNVIKYLDENWCVIINPSWYFTSNGYDKSPFHTKNLQGIKRLENNTAVRNSVNFIGYDLNKYKTKSDRYPFLEVSYPEWGEITFET
uniref:SMEK domain-containing protein n=1 Tax=Roseihalotalea indica TaxID=2867963 RepID=A0AA49GLL6_9BACT|nr:SMEK domain-containing protein [Tunicatimonas sp. TK19036]